MSYLDLQFLFEIYFHLIKVKMQVHFFLRSVQLRAGLPRLNSRQEQETFLLLAVSRSTLGPTQSPIQWVPGDFSPWSKAVGI
jgi:hypothetical protein